MIVISFIITYMIPTLGGASGSQTSPSPVGSCRRLRAVAVCVYIYIYIHTHYIYIYIYTHTYIIVVHGRS